MPDGRKVIIVVLDEQSTENAALTHSEKLKNALDAFVKDLNACEPLPDEFEEIVGQLVKFTRQLQL